MTRPFDWRDTPERTTPMPNNPTLAEQRRAGLVTQISVAALSSLGYRFAGEPLPPPPPPEEEPKQPRQPRTLPPGVYRELSGRLVAKFVRRVNGRKISFFVARGEYFDETPPTIARLAGQCKAAALAWDKEHRRDPQR